MTQDLIAKVQEQYAGAAVRDRPGVKEGVRAVAIAFGYLPDELNAIPAEANLGLSCGNPTAFAGLRPSEVVVDLGCGGGLDVFLAARRVGPSGKAIGIDMTPEMIDRARRNAATQAAANVEFHLARIETLPLPSDSVDCIVSNCVINLAADKAAVFREMHRVLKPGGRVAISDIALKKTLPEELARSVAAYVGCIAGALPVAEYEHGLREAGFSAVAIVNTEKDLNVYSQVEEQAGCCSPAACSCDGPSLAEHVFQNLSELLKRYNINEYAASVQIYAVKDR
jgi:SAM-dependent methyltransferase